MIILCATPACFKDRIFVTAYSYKLQTGSEPCLACVPASPPLVTRDLSFLEPSRASRASSGTVLPSATGQVPAARPSSVKPALSQPRCVKALCHFSPFYPHPCLLYPSPALPLVLTQLSHHRPASNYWHPGASLAGALWRSRHGLHLLLLFFLL